MSAALRWPFEASRVDGQARHALDCGALEPIATVVETVCDGDLPFQIRMVTSLERKRQVTEKRPRDFDPFLPYDQDLYVGDAGPDHAVLLNKFNVLDRHLLIVTREFEHQDEPLSASDFTALARCWTALGGGLAFYNCGTISGASQRHKHLQLVPALGPDDRYAPVEAVLDARSGRVAQFPFVHAVAPLTLPGTDASADGAELAAVYTRLMDAIAPTERGYNLVATPCWMMAIPRAAEHSGRMSVNALGFAGSLLVRDESELAEVRARGPLAVLADVTRVA